MSLEKRIEDLEKATGGENGGRGVLSVFPKDCDSEVTDAQVEEAVRSYEAQHGYPPATIVRVAWDGNKNLEPRGNLK